MTTNSTENDSTPKQARKWLRFSLRSSLLAIALVAVWLAWFVPRVQRQQAAVEWMESFDRTVFYSHMRKPQGQRDPPAPQWLIDIFGIDAFATIDMVWLDDRPVGDISMVRNLPNVNHFELTNGELTDLSPLAGLTKLKHIGVSKNQISDLRPLAGLVNLERFYAYETSISDLEPLSKLTKLENVILSQTPVADISHLSNLTQLYNLELRETKITNLEPIYGLHNLKTLDISDNELSEKQIEELKRKLPNCKVTF